MSELEFHVYTVGEPATRHFLSVLPHAMLGDKPLPSEAIVGELKGGPDQVTPDTFVANNVFVAFLHWVIARHASAHPELQEAARRQQHGAITLVDKRTTQPEGQVPAEDVLGVFEVKAGKVERYRVNPSHKLLTEHGLFEIDGFFAARMLEELRALLAAR